MGGRPFPPGPSVVCGFGKNLVVNVGDVAHKRDIKPVGFKPVTEDIECNAAANMPNMRHRLYRRTTQVHRGVPGADGLKVTECSGRGVVNSKSHTNQCN